MVALYLTASKNRSDSNERNALVFPHAGHKIPVISKKAHFGSVSDILSMYGLKMKITAISINGEKVNNSRFALKLKVIKSFIKYYTNKLNDNIKLRIFQ